MERRHVLAHGIALAFAPALLTPGAITAAESKHGTAEEAKAMVNRALSLINDVGLEAAIAAFHDPDNADFHDRDLYVFIADQTGVSVVHGAKPHVVGLNLIDVTDVNGKHYVREIIEVGLSGTPGWVDYWLDSPTSGTIVSKSSYIVKVSDRLVLGVGIYTY